jgi:hypothetical protein
MAKSLFIKAMILYIRDQKTVPFGSTALTITSNLFSIPSLALGIFGDDTKGEAEVRS